MGRARKAHRKGPARARRSSGLVGTVRVAQHAGYVDTAEGTYRLTGRGLRDAMHGDRVYASIGRGPRGERRAVVEHVIERACTTIVGTYDIMSPLGVVRPLDSRIKQDFFVLPTDDSPARLGVEPGDIVSARIEVYPTRVESGIVTIQRRIGDAYAPDLGIACVMARYDLEDGYAPRALEEADALALDVDGALRDPLRRDIRNRFVLTIDPVDARDFDDAISIEPAGDGGWRLGVHIADVSHYVAWGSSIDLEARRRSTSVYLADRVLPMLPERLSCDLCSLVPDEDRLAFTVDIVLDGRGRVRSYECFPSVIRSRVRLDYAAADVLLASGARDGAGGDRIEDDAAASRARVALEAAAACGVDARAFLQRAAELAEARRELRRARGSIDFETVEVHALLDDSGLPVRIVNRSRTAATGLVEEAMLLANECVAERLADEGVVAAFRVHERPMEDNLVAAARVLVEIGALDGSDALALESGDPHAIAAALDAVHATPYESLANALLLRAMQRALYKPHNEGHYALGASAYCHFTSPIRRYPDLLMHRALKMSLARERLGKTGLSERRRVLTGTGAEALDAIAPQLCRHASERERIADAAAHATQKIKVAQYYGSRIGERASGVISWIDQMGVYVRLDETGAEGLVRLKGLGGEWWEFDERSLTLTGAATGTVISLGRRVAVTVSSVDVLRGHLDFELTGLPSAV